jgi:nucleoside-diphosphate-sugar epimerase
MPAGGNERMRVLVTGGSGLIGRAVVQDLVIHGYEVISADRRQPPSRPADVRFVETNLGDVGQVAGALAGCEAVIHLGAIPHPYEHADEVVFGNNVGATFAVLQAATLLGVQKAVIASSISALGTAYAPVYFPPIYAPVDEEHPLIAKDCYALSKEVDERTGEMFHRRTGMQVAAMRFSLVATMDDIQGLAGQLRDRPDRDDWWRLLWAYVDVRDAASVCRRAVETDGLGFQVFNVTAADTLASRPTEELIRTYAPTVEIRRPIPGTASGFSIEKARRLLGWEPAYTWR